MTSILLIVILVLLASPMWIVPIIHLVVNLSYTPPATFSAQPASISIATLEHSRNTNQVR
jgi:hypothetical protein